MDCPYCGGPMEAGWIPGTDRILRVAWIPETAERRFLLTRTMLTESGGLILQDRPFPAAPYKQVFICRRCRKGVFPSRTTRETSKPKASDSTKQRLPFQMRINSRNRKKDDKRRKKRDSKV